MSRRRKPFLRGVPVAPELPSEDFTLTHIARIRVALESLDYEEAMKARGQITKVLKATQGFGTYDDDYNLTVIAAYQAALTDGDISLAEKIKRNFGKGVHFPRTLKEGMGDSSDEAYRLARRVMDDESIPLDEAF